MRTETKRIIDKQEYTFYQFPPKTGIRVLMKLAKMLGEPLGIAGEGLVKKGAKILDAEVNSALADLAISKIINSLMTNINETEAMNIIDELCKVTYYDGKSLHEVFDIHFQGEYILLGKILKTALEVQYGNFFSAITGLLNSSQAGIKQAE